MNRSHGHGHFACERSLGLAIDAGLCAGSRAFRRESSEHREHVGCQNMNGLAIAGSPIRVFMACVVRAIRV